VCQGGERAAYGPYLALLPADVLADTVIYELVSHYNGNGSVGGVRTARAVVGVGSAVEATYNAEQLRRHRKKVCECVCERDSERVYD
jgi:DNA-directed RNA polymerase, mitochondrial